MVKAKAEEIRAVRRHGAIAAAISARETTQPQRFEMDRLGPNVVNSGIPFRRTSATGVGPLDGRRATPPRKPSRDG